MKTLGIIFSNLHDKELPQLSASRTLASVPFAGRYRFVDFMLSNMVNAGITKVGIITKSNYQSLMDHVGSGKSWDLSRKHGGLIVLPPYGSGETLFKNRFEAVKSVSEFIKTSTEDYVLLSDCDNVCNLDLDKIFEQHLRTKADITAVYREKFIKADDNKERVIFELNGNGKVKKTIFTGLFKGKQPVYTNIMLMHKDFLLSLIDRSGVTGERSFSRDVLTKTSEYAVYGFKFTGFYASVDSIANYLKHSLELLGKAERDSLFNTERPIYTKVRDSVPTKFGSSAVAENSFIADGCIIEGEVRNCVLFRGVTVARGACVENSVIMQNTYIGANSRLNCVVTDKNVTVKEGRNLSGHESQPYFVAKNSII